MGRLTKDPETRYTQSENAIAVARYSLAVPRKFKQEGQDCDFINCVTFGKSAEFAEKYLHKGMRITVSGRIQTNSYTNREGIKVYTTDVVVEEQEFAESKAASQENSSGQPQQQSAADKDGFMHIPDGIDEDVPFK